MRLRESEYVFHEKGPTLLEVIMRRLVPGFWLMPSWKKALRRAWLRRRRARLPGRTIALGPVQFTHHDCRQPVAHFRLVFPPGSLPGEEPARG